MSKSQFVRIGVSLVVIVGAAVILYPRLFTDIRSNGTINARMITIQAPISGTIVRSPIEVGELVNEGDILSRISDDTEPQGVITSLTIERELLAVRVEALSKRIVEVEAIETELEIRVGRYARQTVENLKHRHDEASAREKLWQAVLKERASSLDRQERLLKTGAGTPARVDEATSLVMQAREEVNRARADVQRLTQEYEAAELGIFVNAGQNDVPYSRQRLDEVRLSLADLRMQLSEAASRRKATDLQLSVESARAERRENATVRSPNKGIIWRRLVANNSVVTKNNDISKILDCSRLFVEVGISESSAEDVFIGQPVSVRIQGSKRTFDAKVTEIRGTRSVSPGLEYAAQPPDLKRDEVLLVAEWSDPSIYDTPSNFCNVGRRAEVSISSGLGVLGGN